MSEAKKRALAGNNIFNDAQVSTLDADMSFVLLPAAACSTVRCSCVIDKLEQRQCLHPLASQL